MNNLAMVALAMTLFQSCDQKEEKLVESPLNITKRELVILTESDNPRNIIYVSKVKSFDNYTDFEYWTNKENDTIKLNVDEWDMILVGSKSSFLDSLIVKNNDTLLLSIKDDRFIKKFKNRSLEKWSYNSFFKENAIKDEVDSLYNNLIKVDFENPIELYLQNYKVKTFRLIPNKKISEDSLLLKLVRKYAELIESCRIKKSEDGDDKKKNFYCDLMERKIFDDLHIINYYFNSAIIEDFLLSETFLSDSLTNPSNEYHYLTKLLYKGTFGSGKTGNKDSSINMYTYDSIPYFLKIQWVEKARMIYIEYLAKNNTSIDVVKNGFNRFQNDYDNKVFKQYMEDKYLINLKSLHKSPLKMNFVNAKGETNNLKNLISSLKGNIIYIDYWASWCGPCRKAMPASKELQIHYKDSNIVFVYFSMDIDRDNWLSASKADKINLNDHNYLILNPHTANINNQLKIDKIPRYLLYNKKGELVNHNAPGPNSLEIKKLLDQYIKEEDGILDKSPTSL